MPTHDLSNYFWQSVRQSAKGRRDTLDTRTHWEPDGVWLILRTAPTTHSGLRERRPAPFMGPLPPRADVTRMQTLA